MTCHVVTAAPIDDAESHPVTCRRFLSADLEGLTEDYRGGAMRRRPGLDDDDRERVELDSFVFPEGR